MIDFMIHLLLGSRYCVWGGGVISCRFCDTPVVELGGLELRFMMDFMIPFVGPTAPFDPLPRVYIVSGPLP